MAASPSTLPEGLFSLKWSDSSRRCRCSDLGPCSSPTQHLTTIETSLAGSASSLTPGRPARQACCCICTSVPAVWTDAVLKTHLMCKTTTSLTTT